MQISESNMGALYGARVKSSLRITPESGAEVREMVFEVDEPNFYFKDGQSINVVVPGPHAFGNQYHVRRYTVSHVANDGGESSQMSLLVRRCFYIDEINGEQYPGVASNYLCDRTVGDSITIAGPFNSPFIAPTDRSSNLLMIGTGTGISPFRAFVKSIYDQQGGWDGKVRLFYGAESGLDLYYMNEVNSDLTNYYTQESYEAFTAVAGRPLSGADEALKQGLADHAEMVWALMQDHKTHVYLAGLAKIADVLEQVMIQQAGSAETWNQVKQRLIDGRRWSQLLYID